MYNFVLSPIDPELLINSISEKISSAILNAVSSSTNLEKSDRWFDLTELCLYHPDKPSKQTVYGWVCAGRIPVHKSGKKLRFLKSEIDEWLKTGRKKTLAEIDTDTDAYLLNQKKRR